MWGHKSPTKLTWPEKLTAAPASTQAMRMSPKRVALTGRPRLWAVSSPRQSTSVGRASRQASARAGRIISQAGERFAKLTPEKPPIKKVLPL